MLPAFFPTPLFFFLFYLHFIISFFLIHFFLLVPSFPILSFLTRWFLFSPAKLHSFVRMCIDDCPKDGFEKYPDPTFITYETVCSTPECNIGPGDEPLSGTCVSVGVCVCLLMIL